MPQTDPSQLTCSNGGHIPAFAISSEWVTGWRTVVAGFVGYVAGSTGLFFTFGLFLGPLGAEFHWSREALSAYLTFTSFAYMIAAPVVGRLADRFGPRPVVIFCAIGTATVFALQGLLTPPLWHYYAIAVVGGTSSSRS